MTNKEGLWKSDDPWKFKFDGKFVNIVNIKKNEVLGIGKSDNSTGRVISGGVWSHLTPHQPAPHRLSEISMKNWRAKVKPVLTLHL